MTLTGPGGTGRTRLALQVAAELADVFPGGVFWTPLAAIRDASLVPAAVAHTLGVEEEADPDVAQTIARTLDSRTLLLIDNCEHLLEGVAQILPSVLRATENLKVIATSREPLSLAGERTVAVEPLAHADAVELFRVRAEAAGARDLDEEAVSHLCRRLDELPLAIELAAARTPVLTPSVLLERLPQRRDLLRGTRDVDERQRTLEATIGWSYDLLSTEERRIVRSMSVFVGGATLAAVEEVAEADVDELGSVVAKSLVRMTPTPDGPRYWMLETIREFAADRLGADELAPLQRRHVECFARLAAEGGPLLGERDALLWLDRLDAELGNLRAAFVLATHADDETAALLGAVLGDLHTVRGRYTEAHETLTTAVRHAHDALLKAKLHRLLGDLLVRRDELEAAAADYAAGLKLLGDPSDGDAAWWREWLDLRLNAATLHYWRADSAALHTAAEELAPHVGRHGTPRQRAYLLGTRIFDLLRRDRYAASGEAERLARSYCDAADAAGDWDGHFLLGFVLLWRSNLEEARAHLQQGRDDARAAGDVLTEIRCLVYEALVQRKLGRLEHVRSLDAEIARFDDTYGYTGLIAANRAWSAWREHDRAGVAEHGEAALADWRARTRSGPGVFQWTARFPLLAVAVEEDVLESAAEHARFMLEDHQQPLSADLRDALEDALHAGSREAFSRAVALARRDGYT